ncbi:YcxB family protein [Amycolatopsis mongoliensis]|uniref:YcxB family protein n=1 Tax=Amycolatopsis mongoliensis TaxID=715475 RepID=A0A9Y2JXW4_9PSEU|nr:YcxB family protein [Amycolatopsis sp. 4-36]WIY06761.1 YcxB family protein [Amycolatopsis sp. 4-36]
MQISMAVPYDEERLRRTIRFILRPQLKTIRVLGGVLAVLGIALVALDPADPMSYGVVVLGLLFATAIAPITLARSMRLQSPVIKDGCRITLDDEWVTVAYPLAESRFRWAGLDRVIETPEVWYVMFSKIQAATIPKEPMTGEQRREFAAFVDRLPAVGGRSPSRNRR